MVPVNGKPIIWWILNSLKEHDQIDRIIVVVDEEDVLTHQYLYENSVEVIVAKVRNSKSILHSLENGLKYCEPLKSTGIILGDTLFQGGLNTEKDVLYIHPVKQASRWCIAELEASGVIKTLYDKPLGHFEDAKALCGYYHFVDTPWLQSCLNEALQLEEKELSACILKYHIKRPVTTLEILEWFDFGNPDYMISSKHRLLQSRSFNRVTVNSQTNTIIKRSGNVQKLQDELAWFESLPKGLSIFTPRLVHSGKVEHEFFIEQEFYGYYTLSELFLFADLDLAYWETILEKILNAYSLFTTYNKDSNVASLKLMYAEKTKDRVSKILTISEIWNKRLIYDGLLFINGSPYRSFESLTPWILEKIENLCTYPTFNIIHGDLCFSNILFDLNGHIPKFIDPRGRFGEERLYGDPRYDMAKLRHSVHGKYDFIVNDLFDLKELGQNEFSFRFLHERVDLHAISDIFDQLLVRNGYDVLEIAFIEALLFLTMIPLHDDNSERQLAMYLTAIQLFNKIYKDENSH
jgi:dTDP-glucose pyrophosphorylase